MSFLPPDWLGMVNIYTIIYLSIKIWWWRWWLGDGANGIALTTFHGMTSATSTGTCMTPRAKFRRVFFLIVEAFYTATVKNVRRLIRRKFLTIKLTRLGSWFQMVSDGFRSFRRLIWLVQALFLSCSTWMNYPGCFSTRVPPGCLKLSQKYHQVHGPCNWASELWTQQIHNIN